MKKNKFKTLMYCGMYVDVNLLEKGIYTCSVPFLYDTHTTIESMIAKAERVQDIMGKHHVSDKYFENIKQCKLITVIITEE